MKKQIRNLEIIKEIFLNFYEDEDFVYLNDDVLWLLGDYCNMTYTSDEELIISFHININPVKVALIVKTLVTNKFDFYIGECYYIDDKGDMYWENDENFNNIQTIN